MENQSNHRLSEDPRVDEEFMNASFEQENEEGSVNETGLKGKETRGPTYMQNIWGRAPHLPLLHVEYNKHGQPIGGENSKLCHFLGSIARNDKYCPVDVNDWHAFPTTKKKDILDVVKLRFHVTATAEKWILSSVGNKWKNWKHTLKARYWCENVAIEHLIEERDERVPVDKWVKLLTYWNTDEAKKISHRNENARRKKTMNQRTGKTSFAQIKSKMTKEKGRSPTRVELFHSCFVPSSNGTPNDVALSKYSEMLERSDQLSEDFNDSIGPDDVFAQIMGKDTSGHVRMMGQGVCPRDVWSETPRSTSNRLMMEQQAQIAHLENMLSMQQKSSQLNKGQCDDTFTFISPNASSTLPLKVGNYVSLRSLFNPNKVVAEGYVHNTEPTTKVGGQLLGMNWCEVNVKVAIEQAVDQAIR